MGEFYCDHEFTLGLDVVARWEGVWEGCEGGEREEVEKSV